MKTDQTMPTPEPTPEDIIHQFTTSKVRETHRAAAEEVRAHLSRHLPYATEAERLLLDIREKHGPRLQERRRILNGIDLAAQPQIRRAVEPCATSYGDLIGLLYGVGWRPAIPAQLRRALDLADGITGTEPDLSVIERDVMGLIATAIGAPRPGHTATDVAQRYEEDIARADRDFLALSDLLQNTPGVSTVFPVRDTESQAESQSDSPSRYSQTGLSHRRSR